MRDVRGARAGSSPHTRGAPGCGLVQVAGEGIIPAYAGSTSSIASPTRSARDHPRIRGEHSMYSNLRTAARGSSPHTRGAPVVRVAECVLVRIIPAYAGSTDAWSSRRMTQADHPRIRGEHDTPLTNVTPFTGSSPHTRGAPLARHDRRVE